MAVTGAIFKTLTFNGESSKNYGVYITGSGAYDAPKRDVEMITIAGRNGSFPLDHGRFENIEVTYPAGIFGDDEEDFADAISNFRNMLCSAKGYCRLEDDYNPDEYRLAIYKSGLEVEPALLKAGEFEIVFECKPQRFLKSGETPVTIGASTTVANPTRFESSPEVRVKGYGTVAFNGYAIDIQNAVYGNVILVEDKVLKYNYFKLNTNEYANNGDTITLKTSPSVRIGANDPYVVNSKTITGTTATGTAFLDGGLIMDAGFRDATFTFTKGTASGEACQINASLSMTNLNTEVTFTATLTVRFDIDYDPATDMIEYTTTVTTSPSSLFTVQKNVYRINSASVYGSKSILGNPTIIDCDLGEAYKETASGIISLDAYIDLGTDLPTLASGNNTAIKDNTITECKIIPRWWKI